MDKRIPLFFVIVGIILLIELIKLLPYRACDKEDKYFCEETNHKQWIIFVFTLANLCLSIISGGKSFFAKNMPERHKADNREETWPWTGMTLV
jgi:hypothetical protein